MTTAARWGAVGTVWGAGWWRDGDGDEGWAWAWVVCGAVGWDGDWVRSVGLGCVLCPMCVNAEGFVNSDGGVDSEGGM